MPFPFTTSSRNKRKLEKRLNILLSNGRFPVTIDIARQLKRLGHAVYVVDPMEYHVCKFSNAVKKSFYVPAPHVDPEGYINAVKHAVDVSHIDIIIPLHEEVLYLAKSGEPEIINRLFAPSFPVLLRLHNKWEFSKWLGVAGLDRPQTWLCKSRDDILALDLSKELALKPVFGRAKSGVHHHKPNEPIPDDLPVGDEIHYIAQEWISGNSFCTYSLVRDGIIQAFAVYPVIETLDGSSCVYFEAIEHPRIREYCERVAAQLKGQSGQIALDFIEQPADQGGRLVAIECNPRATSGIHLYSGTTHLAKAFVDPTADPPAIARTGAHRQVAPGMMMWERKDVTAKRYAQHMGRLVSSRDVVFSTHDFLPTLMQPFLLTSYYKICQERRLKLPEMFQWDLTWEPQGEELRRVRQILEDEEREEEARSKQGAVGEVEVEVASESGIL